MRDSIFFTSIALPLMIALVAGVIVVIAAVIG
jgi:hypothetical protein